MSTKGRITGMVVAAAVLVAGTVVAMHYLRPETSPPAQRPAMVETPGQPKAGDALALPAAPKLPSAGTAGRTADAAVVSPAGSGEAAADDGLALMNSGRLFQAQQRLSEALKAGIGGPKGKAVRDALLSLAERVQFSGQHTPDDPYSKSYEVARGDNVTVIGRKFLIPRELVMKLNRLGSPGITAGQSLNVIQGPIHLEIFKGRHELLAWLGDVCVRVYPVGVGKSNSTPEVTFTVKSKMINPPYQPQHKAKSEFRAAGAPDNPLGTRWIDLGNHYGIHGTIDPTSIGRDVSEGCIRMNNKDVEELFDLVVEGATKVTVRP